MAKQENVLTLDCALNGCVVAVAAGDKIVTRTFPTDREQAARLLPLIQEAMAGAGLEFADLGLIVTTVGPGSFTGLRIGLTTARTLALSLDIPVHGISTFVAMAASCHQKGDARNLLVLLETKRQDFYVQLCDAALNPVGDGTCANLQTILARFDLTDVVLAGDAVTRFVAEAAMAGPTLTNDQIIRTLLDPEILFRHGLNDFHHNGNPAIRPQPVYLRNADVSVSNKIQRVIKESPL